MVCYFLQTFIGRMLNISSSIAVSHLFYYCVCLGRMLTLFYRIITFSKRMHLAAGKFFSVSFQAAIDRHLGNISKMDDAVPK